MVSPAGLLYCLKATQKSQVKDMQVSTPQGVVSRILFNELTSAFLKSISESPTINAISYADAISFYTSKPIVMRTLF